MITVLVAVVGGLAFFCGIQYQKMQATTFTSGQYGQNGGQGAGRLGGRAGGSRPTTGQVISQDATGFIVKLPDGSSKIILVGSSTMFVKTSTASASDIKNGDRLMVFGTQNSDGSATAQNIQINPPQRIMMQPSPTGAK